MEDLHESYGLNVFEPIWFDFLKTPEDTHIST